MPKSPMPFFWYELMTSDPKAATAFYSDVVGWKPQAFGEGSDYTDNLPHQCLHSLRSHGDQQPDNYCKHFQFFHLICFVFPRSGDNSSFVTFSPLSRVFSELDCVDT